MDTSLLVYLSILLSVANLGFSWFVWKKLMSRPIVVPPTKPKEAPQKRKEVEKPVVKNVVEPVDVVILKETPDKPKVVSSGKMNTWYLEATGEEGKNFSIQVEWSDGSSDVVLTGVVPVELEFTQPRGVVPVKIIGIPPHEDKEVNYLWELNGFHWS